jgi:hypothetical protein
MTMMLYSQWATKVLHAMDACENVRTRLVGLPASGLRETLGVGLGDVDAIEDALYDLDVLSLARRRPSSGYNLTRSGRGAGAGSVEDVCGAAIRETCAALTDDEHTFLQALMKLSQSEEDAFARLRYVNVDQAFAQIGFTGSHEQQESFLLPLVESNCIDYQEFPSARTARPLITGVICAVTAREDA